tara:strand:+ start:461 stop:646 length:186 start_codon:yes stop_codon:yes gene_type:complete
MKTEEPEDLPYSDEELLSKCINLFNAYMFGSQKLERLDKDARKLIQDIRHKYPELEEEKSD